MIIIIIIIKIFTMKTCFIKIVPKAIDDTLAILLYIIGTGNQKVEIDHHQMLEQVVSQQYIYHHLEEGHMGFSGLFFLPPED